MAEKSPIIRMKRTPLRRKKSVPRESKGLFDHIPKENKNLFSHLSKPSKDEEWASVREELRDRFSRVGIISCEVGYKNCIKSYNFGFGWTFAHSLKRDKIPAEKDNPELRHKLIREVIYACVSCHNELEKLGNKENQMHDAVVSIIKRRKIQP